jgi:hypothetical protein
MSPHGDIIKVARHSLARQFSSSECNQRTRKIYRSAKAGTGGAQQKLMRHGGFRTTMNVYGDVVTNEIN